MASKPFSSPNPGTASQKSPSQTSPDRIQDATTNGNIVSAATTTAALPALTSSPGAPNNFPSSTTISPKKWPLSFGTPLTRIHGTGNSNKQPASPEERTEAAETTSNAGDSLKAGFSVGRPEDAPPQANNTSTSSFPHSPRPNTQALETSEKEGGRHPGLGGLPSIATAASAMQIDTDTSPSTAGPGGTTAGDSGVTAGPAYMLHTPSSAHPMSADSATPSTPGFPLSATTPTTPYTSSSLHTPISAGGGRSKHTCTHCNQTFTRHHNLKSHLLTHSHEKPFPCNQCTARFRRLHDLKRHSKLHTGERPHMCEKCGRRFARGDALARHARGEGGCAGRRNSIGGILDGDTLMVGDGTGTDGDDDGMVDDGDTHMENSNDPGTPSVEVGASATSPDTTTPAPAAATTTASGARRPASLPSIKTNVADNNHLHPHHPPQIQHIHQLQSFGTYPPMTPIRSAISTAGPSPGTSLFPPTPSHHGKNTPISATSSPSVLSNRRGTSPMSGVTSTTPSILQSGGMTESPRAISPAQPDGATRAKSPLTQFQSSGTKYAPPITPQSAQASNPPTNFGSSGPTSHPVHTRQPSQPSSQAQPQQPQQAAQAQMSYQQPHKTGTSSGAAGGGSNENPNIFENERGIWDYVKELERRIVDLESKQRSYDALLAQVNQQSLAVAAVAASAQVRVANSGNNTATAATATGNGNTQGGDGTEASGAGS